MSWGRRTTICEFADRRNVWKDMPKNVRAVYLKSKKTASSILSTTGHVEPCRKQPGPSGKPKYSLMTDSEPVP